MLRPIANKNLHFSFRSAVHSNHTLFPTRAGKSIMLANKSIRFCFPSTISRGNQFFSTSTRPEPGPVTSKETDLLASYPICDN